MTQDLIQEAAKLIQNAKIISVLTGAGISKESGIPTYRDMDDGEWNKIDPREIATRRVIQEYPERVWAWSMERYFMMRAVKPNPGHQSLAKLAELKEVHIITQNIDDLHEQAGSPNIIHMHGQYNRYKCGFDCQGTPTSVNYVPQTKADSLPECPHCGRWIRPDIVLFGELLDSDVIKKVEFFSENCDVMLVIGTSGLVSPADRLPRMAKRAGAKIIEINPAYSMITRFADIKIESASGEALPELIKSLEEKS